MLLIVLSVSLLVFAAALLVIVTAGSRVNKPAVARLAALDRGLASVKHQDHEDKATDIRREEQKLSAIPWLNGILNRMDLSAAAGLFLYQAGVKATLGALILTSIVGSGVVWYIGYLRSGAAFPAVLFAACVLPMPYLYVRHKRSQRLSALEQQLPEAIAMMVGAIRVGHSLIASLGTVGQESPEPIGGEFRKCFEEQNYGTDLRTAFVNLTVRAPIQDLRIFVAAVLIQKESGGNLGEVLEKVAQTTRERFRLKKQVSVHTAQGRLTGWILSILPVALGTAMYFMNPDVMSVLWKKPVGIKMLFAAAAMDVVGGLIIRKIVRIRV